VRLTKRVGEALDERLSLGVPAPVLVGFSGGGDSLALLLLAHAWAAQAGRALLAVTVDHGLQPEAPAWSRLCAERCARLGVRHVTLRWEGKRPKSGLPAAAREARHRLLALAARDAGAKVVLLGHTADDIAEAAWMRRAGASTGAPRPWSPSPTWPEGRGVFIQRPLLGVRRGEIRAWLLARGESWIEDPANEDGSSLRARARRALAAGDPSPPILAESCRPGPPPLAEDPAGGLLGERARFAAAPGPLAQAWLGAAVLCASGQSAPPRRAALQTLLARVRSAAPVRATLGGARVICDGESLLICREGGDRRAGGVPDLDLACGERLVWDGRFEVIARRPGLRVTALGGHAAALPAALRKRTRAAAAAGRGAAPVVVGPDGVILCPTFAPDPTVEVQSLIRARLSGACGGVNHESAIL
jgi:tRNA(Ile)-lysidine synthase